MRLHTLQKSTMFPRTSCRCDCTWNRHGLSHACVNVHACERVYCLLSNMMELLYTSHTLVNEYLYASEKSLVFKQHDVAVEWEIAIQTSLLFGNSRFVNTKVTRGCDPDQCQHPLKKKKKSRTTTAFAPSGVEVGASTSQRAGQVDPSHRRRARTSTCGGCSGTNNHHPTGANRDRRGTCRPCMRAGDQKRSDRETGNDIGYGVRTAVRNGLGHATGHVEE